MIVTERTPAKITFLAKQKQKNTNIYPTKRREDTCKEKLENKKNGNLNCNLFILFYLFVFVCFFTDFNSEPC